MLQLRLGHRNRPQDGARVPPARPQARPADRRRARRRDRVTPARRRDPGAAEHRGPRPPPDGRRPQHRRRHHRRPHARDRRATGRPRAARTASSRSTSRARLGRARRRRHLGRHARDARARSRRATVDAGETVAAIGITNQRETVVVWRPHDRAARCTGRSSGRTAAPRPTATRCATAGHEPLIRERTGLVLDPYFSATQARVAAAPRAASRRRPTSRSAPSTRGCCTGCTGGARARDRPVEREPHDALRHRSARAGPTSCATLFGVPDALPARGAPEQRPVRDDRPRRRGRPHGPGERDRRRPAGRALRPGVLRARA